MKMYQLPNIDFVGKRNIWFKISSAIVILAVIFLLIRGLNLGIDFTGGIILEMEFDEHISTSEAREILAEFDLDDSVIQPSGNRLLIRTPPIVEEEELGDEGEERADIIADIYNRFDQSFEGMEERRTEMVGPTIGRELRRAAIYALIIASLLIVLYISIRFEFKYAIIAIIALIHDVLFVLGIFSILQWQLNSPFIAGLLTIMGYSINDTIVIFDRVRENLKMYSRRKSLEEVNNLSLNETLTRSINTSFTTLLVIITLMLFTGGIIRSFIFSLFLGVLAGTFSSIFLASPLLVAWTKWEKSRGESRPQES